MAFVDEITIHLKAGHGGSGVVRWRREKHVNKGGPSGGDGGKGGDVWIEAVRDTGHLARYSGVDTIEAGDGEAGSSRSRHGKSGDDAVVTLPVGSVVKNLSTKEEYELLEVGEKYQVLKGGNGGYGNEHFKSSTNQNPMERTPGKLGEEADFFIELKLVVDAGFVGFPNAGKSTLLNTLTNAESKVGDYAFTTLSPHLGDLYGFVLADIPGLIEGASGGKGLGHRFLRHVSRTRLLIHCVSADQENVSQAYETIRSELKEYDSLLTKKPELLVITKADELNTEEKREIEKEMREFNPGVLFVSVLDEGSVKNLQDTLLKKLRELKGDDAQK